MFDAVIKWLGKLPNAFGRAVEKTAEPETPPTVSIQKTDIIRIFFETSDFKNIPGNIINMESIAKEAIEKVLSWATQHSGINPSSAEGIAFTSGIYALQNALEEGMQNDSPTVDVEHETLELLTGQLNTLSTAAEKLKRWDIEPPSPQENMFAWDQPSEGETYRTMADKLLHLNDSLLALMNKYDIQAKQPATAKYGEQHDTNIIGQNNSGHGGWDFF